MNDEMALKICLSEVNLINPYVQVMDFGKAPLLKDGMNGSRSLPLTFRVYSASGLFLLRVVLTY